MQVWQGVLLQSCHMGRRALLQCCNDLYLFIYKILIVL
jgi:hypothetical protein